MKSLVLSFSDTGGVEEQLLIFFKSLKISEINFSLCKKKENRFSLCSKFF